MAELLRLDVTARPDAADIVTGILTCFAAATGWEECSLPDGGTCFRVYAENPAFLHDLRAELAARAPRVQSVQQTIEKKDWVLAWREFFTPVFIRDAFVVIAPWMESDFAAARPAPIIIEPKFAFGTGHHATTTLCLSLLTDMWQAQRLRPGMTFLDVGTGSGILAIAAAKCGLSGMAVDTDPLATENAQENRHVNHVETQVDIRLGSLEAASSASFDLIMANILAGPLKDMAPAMTARLNPGGALLLSGILTTQADEVARAYMAQGLGSPLRAVDGEWTALLWS